MAVSQSTGKTDASGTRLKVAWRRFANCGSTYRSHDAERL